MINLTSIHPDGKFRVFVDDTKHNITPPTIDYCDFLSILRRRSLNGQQSDGGKEVDLYFQHQIDPDHGDAMSLHLYPFSEWHTVLETFNNLK